MGTLSVWLQRAATHWVHCATGVPHLTRFLLPSTLKAIPGQASALFTGQGSVLCRGLWEFQVCQYFINFVISDPNESFVLFLKLLHKVFFALLRCYSFSSHERTKWKISAIFHLLFLVECIKLSIACVFVSKCCVVPHSLFLSDIGVRYCEVVFVWVPQVCVINYVCAQ